MKKIIRGRGQGKTTDLIKVSHGTGKYIVVANQQQAHLIKDMAKDMGLEGMSFPITVDEIKRYGAGAYSTKRGVLVDNAEMVLEVFMGTSIDTLTMSE